MYVIGGLVDRRKIKGASYKRAAALGLRCARLPLLEYLPQEMRGRSNSLDALNLNSVFLTLVEWSKSRDWTAAIRTAFEKSQRHCGSAEGFIHPHGYWDGPQAASQHQYDASLSEALATNTNVKTLHISFNPKLTDEGIKRLLPGLRKSAVSESRRSAPPAAIRSRPPR